MKRAISVLSVLVVLGGLFVPATTSAATADARVPVIASPPGQVSIATVNARQNKILRYNRFVALLELSKAFRFRPLAFNGGTRGAVIAPDVVAISEFRETNVEIITNLMEEKFDEPYVLVGPTDVQAALVVNTRTVELQGSVELVDDVCLNDETSDKPRLYRQYPMARFREISTNSMFTVVGVHLSRDYSESGQSDCLIKNVREIRSRTENDPGAAFVAGDFNFRPTYVQYECDPNENGAPSSWWEVMTTDDGVGREYLDSVQSFHKARSLPMMDEWTYQHPSEVTTCGGAQGVRRSRIDYIFSSDAQVAEAHADHPGWTVSANPKYSDHRFVLGRYVLSGPPRVRIPTVEPRINGEIHLTWNPVEGAESYIVYRALPGSDYSQIATVGPTPTSKPSPTPTSTPTEQTPGPALITYVDRDTAHDETYRYAIAAVGVDTGQGVESAPVWETADARGPQVTGIVPGRGATGVSPSASIRVSFDEWVEATSVDASTISLYRNGNRISGRVVRKGGFVIKFNPNYDLKKGETFTVVVRSVTDVLGNTGPVFKSRFSTVEPPKRRSPHRR